MNSFAHIINPVIVPPASDLYIAQPITFETMRRAKETASGRLDISINSAQYPEDRSLVPDDFHLTPDLQRSVMDVANFQKERKLPLLRDILDRLFAATDANYLIYTNVDIALQPNFYLAVQDFIDNGLETFVINRRTIPGNYSAIEEIPQMVAEKGKPHKGWDCFIFPREIYPQFYLGDVCIGASRVGLALLANLVAYGGRFKEFTAESLTFHIGDDRYWHNPAYRDYDDHNTQELMEVLNAIEADAGPFPRESIPGQFLWRKRTFGPLYEFWARNVYLPAGASRLINRFAGRKSS